MPVDQVAGVIAVRNRLVAASRPVLVSLGVPCAGVIGRATHDVRLGRLETVLIHMVLVEVMQAPVVEVVDVIAMANRRMTTARAVGVRVVLMHNVSHPEECRVRAPSGRASRAPKSAPNGASVPRTAKPPSRDRVAHARHS